MLDEKDKAIIKCFLEKPSSSLQSISEEATKIGELDKPIPYPTAQKRVQSLIDQGVMSKVTFVNKSKAGYTQHYRIGIIIDPSELRNKDDPSSQQELAKYVRDKLCNEKKYRDKILLDDIFILLGGNIDLSLDIWARDHNIILDFVTAGLRMIPGIADTTTAQVAWSVREGDC
jgi:DNA-binding Lrp family transcriptional regulator